MRYVLLLTLLLLVAGCIKEQPLTPMQAIQLGFVEGAPPDRFSENQEVNIRLRAVNRGDHTVEAGALSIKLKGNAATDIFNPSTTEASNSRPVYSQREGNGEVDIDLGSIRYEPEEMIKQYAPDITVEYCYPYGTEVITNNFFVGDDTRQVSKGRITTADNSKAPIIITNLNEAVSSDMVTFDFTVAKRGGGKIVDECFASEEETGFVSVNILSPAVSCRTFGGGSSGNIEVNKKVYCSVPYVEGQTHSEQLQIRLEYLYQDAVRKTVVISPEDYP